MRGGISHDQRPGCTENAATSPCAISIRHGYLGTGAHYEKYNSWRIGSTRLNWYGGQPDQELYYGQPAQGSPAVWTTNDPTHPGYQPLNKYGPNYWMVDVSMDCSQSLNGWFEVKYFITNANKGSTGWENNLVQAAICGGTAGGLKPSYQSGNHFGRCGFINVFVANFGSCFIENF